MGPVRNSTQVGIRLGGALLLLIVLGLGLMAPSGASAATTFDPGDTVVANDVVNVRTRAGTSAPIRAIAEPGDQFTIGQINPRQANGYLWYRVSTPNRVNYGWIASDFLDLVLPFEEGDCATVFDGALNLRSSPRTSASVVEVLADGSGVQVLGNDPVRANGYLWYRVDVSGSNTVGWVVSEFLQLQNCGSTDVDPIEVGTTVRVFDGPLNVRENPGLSADIIRVLPTGAAGVIVDGPETADGYVWFEFRNLGGANGWIVSDFIVADPDVDLGEGPNTDLMVGDSFIVTTDALNVRSSAGLDGVVIDVAGEGAVGTRVAGNLIEEDNFAWIRVNIPGVGTGWVVLEFLAET